MSWTASCKVTSDQGFSLIEVLIALLITVIVMSAVFGLLVRGQRGFQREPEIADMNQNTRFGLDMISRDLAMAGYRTPPDRSRRTVESSHCPSPRSSPADRSKY